VEGEKD